MSVPLVALDYSRPIQPLFEQGQRVGAVHSVFGRAMNITCGGTMLALLDANVPRMPNSIRISSSAMQALAKCAQPGMHVWIDNQMLSIGDCNFSLLLPQTPSWEPRPPVAGHQWSNATIAYHACVIARSLASRAGRDGLASLVGPLLLEQSVSTVTITPLISVALPLLRLLARASWRLESASVEEAARGLAGLGPGLTPSGDDALGGFVAVMALLSPIISADGVSRAHLAEVIARTASPRTTTLSAVLLAHAARGEMAEHMGDLLLTLARPVEASGAALAATERVLAFGSSSGGDILVGLLLGLRTLSGEIA